MNAEDDGSAEYFQNYYDSALVNIGCIVFGLIAIGILMDAGDSRGSQAFGLAVLAPSVAMMIRCWSRPSISVGSRAARVNGTFRQSFVEFADVKRFWTGPARIGAFMRVGLGVDLVDGSQKDLAKLGIWARRGSSRQRALLAVVAEMNRRVAEPSGDRSEFGDRF